MRPYKLRVNKDWRSYKTLMSACWDLAVQLYTYDHLDLLLSGEFENTYFLDKVYSKRYVIRINLPYTTWILEKKTKGNLDREEVIETLRLVKRVIDERISNKT